MQNAHEHVKGMTLRCARDMETVSAMEAVRMQMLAIDPQRFLHTVIWPGLYIRTAKNASLII